MTVKGITLDVLDAQERAVDAELAQLQLRREVIQSLRKLAVDLPSGNGTAPVHRLVTFTDTVVRYVSEHEGLTSGEIARGIKAEFDQAGKRVGGSDPHKTILTTLGAVVQKGRVQKTPEGLHYVEEEP